MNDKLQKLDLIMLNQDRKKQTYADYQYNLYKKDFDVKSKYRKKVKK